MTGTLVKKFKLRITVHNKSGRKKIELNKEEEAWIENFLDQALRIHLLEERILSMLEWTAVKGSIS